MPADHSYTFVCSECRQKICAIMGKEHVPFDLCAMCITMPGWFLIPDVAAIFHYDPEPEGNSL